MYDHSNIEFINFDTITHPECEHNIEFDLGCLEAEEINHINLINEIVLDRYDSGNESQYDSLFTDSRSQLSLSLEFAQQRLTETINTSGNDNNLPIAVKAKESEASILSDKPFECQVKSCNKRFKFKWILDRHYSTHKSTRMFKCPYVDCMKSYKSKENLTLHIKNIHLKEKPYSCKFCKSVFSHRNGKTYHERKFHTNYLPHKCIFEECHFSFASKSALNYHLKSHHSENKKKFKNNIFRSKFVKGVDQILNMENNNYYYVNDKNITGNCRIKKENTNDENVNINRFNNNTNSTDSIHK